MALARLCLVACAQSQAEGRFFVKPCDLVLLLVGLAAATLLVEGAMLDWSDLSLRATGCPAISSRREAMISTVRQGTLHFHRRGCGDSADGCAIVGTTPVGSQAIKMNSLRAYDPVRASPPPIPLAPGYRAHPSSVRIPDQP